MKAGMNKEEQEKKLIGSIMTRRCINESHHHFKSNYCVCDSQIIRNQSLTLSYCWNGETLKITGNPRKFIKYRIFSKPFLDFLRF